MIFQFLAPGAPGGFPGRSRSWGSIKNEPKFSHIPLTSQSKFTRSTFSVNKFKKQFIRITFYKNCSENAPISPAPPGARRCTHTYTYTVRCKTRTHAHTHTHRHTDRHAHMDTYTQIHTHTCGHIHAQTHTDTYTHIIHYRYI